MHPSSPCSLMTRLACAASLGLVMTTAPLGLSAVLHAAVRVEDDRGSGRLSRVPAIAGWLGFRGSDGVNPTPPQPSFDWDSPVAYRGSGRITEPRTT